MELRPVYDLGAERELIEQLQRASRDESTSMGLSLQPALVGSEDWWRRVEAGAIPVETLRGHISRVLWTGFGDHPEVEITSDGGERSRWTREGDAARYVEGLAIELRYVRHPWKVRGGVGIGDDALLVLHVAIEASDLRSEPVGPGPYGRGMTLPPLR